MNNNKKKSLENNKRTKFEFEKQINLHFLQKKSALIFCLNCI